jgi:hypothetical protein
MAGATSRASSSSVRRSIGGRAILRFVLVGAEHHPRDQLQADLGAVAAHLGAVRVQRVELVPVLVHGHKERVPPVGVGGHVAQRHALARASDPERDMRGLQRLGLATRVAQLVVAPVECGGLLRPQRLHDRGGLAEHREALPERREWDPVLATDYPLFTRGERTLSYVELSNALAARRLTTDALLARAHDAAELVTAATPTD